MEKRNLLSAKINNLKKANSVEVVFSMKNVYLQIDFVSKLKTIITALTEMDISKIWLWKIKKS